MKHILFVVCLLMSSMSLLADDYNYLVVNQTDNSSLAFKLRKMRSIKFNGNSFTVVTTDDETEVPLTTLRNLTFTESAPVGIHSVSGTWEPQRIVIYNMSGMVVRQIHSTDARSENVNLNNLPSGVYIIKEGSQTRKLLKR